MTASTKCVDSEIGFCRPEMGSERLAGSVNATFSHQIFLVWGKAAEWPEKVPDDCPDGSLPKAIGAALSDVSKATKKKFKFTLVQAEDGDREGDVLVFPEYVRFRVEGADRLVASLSTFLQNGKSSCVATDVEDLGGSFAFICAHANRDERCGHCGPRLFEELTAQTKVGQHQGLRVLKTSHVGGHKYAGCIITFSGKGTVDDGNWYGYVTPQSVSDVVDGRNALGHLWRGRLGLSEDDAVRARRTRVMRDIAPVVVAASVAVLATVTGLVLLRRRRSER
eukprot:TRINITY_DN57811_c0_g1_i1.p1 TRINITY_DN57811_c0_g1~~TRINITY_DN57811_c0_g1_i1.p1  ORF type:complete len:280 (+),score=42.81 TRINITY_DN57811_c0_g1_i1:41-880(+)